MKKHRRFSYLKAQKRYAGKFIARKGAQILAAGTTLGDVFKQLKRRGVKYSPSVVIGHIPPPNAICIYVLRRISS